MSNDIVADRSPTATYLRLLGQGWPEHFCERAAFGQPFTFTRPTRTDGAPAHQGRELYAAMDRLVGVVAERIIDEEDEMAQVRA